MEIYRDNLYQEDYEMELAKSLFLSAATFDDNLQRMNRDGLEYKGKFRETLLSFYTVPESMRSCADKISPDLSKCKVLCDDVELAKANILKNFDMLGFASLPEGEKLKVAAKKYLRVYLVKGYYFAKSLEAIMSKPEAIAYYQGLVDARTREHGTGKKVEKVSDYLFKNEKLDGAFVGAFDYSECEPGPGRVAKKIKKCKWAEVLKEVNDPDYAYAIACHYDYEATKAENPAFLLTRTGTLTKGDSCCDFLWHDTRVDKDLSHLPKEFWDNLG